MKCVHSFNYKGKNMTVDLGKLASLCRQYAVKMRHADRAEDFAQFAVTDTLKRISNGKSKKPYLNHVPWLFNQYLDQEFGIKGNRESKLVQAYSIPFADMNVLGLAQEEPIEHIEDPNKIIMMEDMKKLLKLASIVLDKAPSQIVVNTDNKKIVMGLAKLFDVKNLRKGA